MPDVNDPAQKIGSLHEQLDRIEHLVTETCMHPAACGFCQQGTAWARRAGVYGTGRSQKTLPPNAQRDRLAGDNRAEPPLSPARIWVSWL
jgi:hypothetical protein